MNPFPCFPHPTSAGAAAQPFRCLSRFAILFQVFALAANAQQTAPVPASEEIVELSVFEVKSERDVGYAAASALTGTRTDSLLKESPVSVSVLTREFLDDLVLLDNTTQAEWGNNTMPSYATESTFSGDIQVRFRGVSLSLPTRNYFLWYDNSDSYNIERVDLARGPNGVLFGDGYLGGIATTWTKRAKLGKNERRVSFLADSYGGFRASFDVNQAIGRNVAFRLNGMTQELETWRDGSDARRDGLHLAATWRITKDTNIRAEAEYGKRKRPIYAGTYAERVSYWDGTSVYVADSSDPLNAQYGWGQISTTAQMNARGITRSGLNSSDRHWLWIPGVPEAGYRNWSSTFETRGSGASMQAEPGAEIPNVPLLPYKEINIEPTNDVIEGEYYTYTSYVTHRFKNGISIELAYNQYKTDKEGPAEFAVFGDYKIDLNKYLPRNNSSEMFVLNPKYGIPFSDQMLGRTESGNLTKDLRLAVNWQLNRRLISESLSVLAGSRWNDAYTRHYVYAMVDNRSPGFSYVRARMYWDEPQQHDTSALETIIPELTGVPYAWRPSGITYSSQDLQYLQAVSSTKLIGQRLIITLGARHDKYKGRQQSGATSGKYGYDDTGYPIVLDDPNVDISPTSYNAGVVFRATQEIGVYAGYSESFAIPLPGNGDIYGKPMDVAINSAREFGVKFDFFKGKLSGGINYYNSIQEGVPGYDNTRRSELQRLWQNTSDQYADFMMPSYRDTRDYKGTGYEIDITANPTRSIRIMANFALPQTKAVNLMPQLRKYFYDNLAVWQAATNDPATDPAKTQQINDDITAIQSTLTGLTPGTKLTNTVNYSANFYGTYTVQGGVFRNLGVGLGVNVRGRNKIGNHYNEPFHYIYSGSYYVLSGHVSYSRRIGPTRARFQINVANILDNDDVIYTSSLDYRVDGTVTGPIGTGRGYYRYNDPRKITFTASFEF
ncbi:TonB-dependent receptor [Termitidicoccus mucosus]|uniref:TonB-dependent receptor-like beta-barrel domain-containing protein n=1 Tax=Termitidicoccus mucosus TaxID=1184151 RepID=A0A178IMW5_9BACT|nr:hypothetical protein AW736_04195 [Opitutaceae bacterium TSB47]